MMWLEVSGREAGLLPARAGAGGMQQQAAWRDRGSAHTSYNICRCLWRGVPRAALLKLAFNLHRSWMIHVNILLEAWVYMRAWILHWKKGEGKLLSVRYQSAGLCSAREEEMRCSYALSTLTSQHLAFKYLRYYETGMVLGKFMAAHRFWIEERKWVAHPLFKESHEWC